MQIVLEPIGYVRGGRPTREDDDWEAVEAEIVLDPARFKPDALLGLDTFSHVEVLFHFDQFDPSRIVTGARHPRGREDWPKVGIFAQRGSGRPNLLGVTICQVLCVAGHSIWLRGLDAIDGTPVLDLKPYLSGFAPRGEIREPGWAIEIMADYWTCS
ncbi:MAG: tRNA (N6-threonylcarbamoyladenosine(37)-N6)-methyltransferase TrmO [Rhodospirillaceae bacterium]|nr:tRNA (N6-threonylcarbamoyladenosine(37)-N6)-methyltransferase TrmO [Rhodospirillaceae bacterium]